MDLKEIKIETPEFNENVKSVKNPFGVGFIKQEQPEHTPDSYAIKTETPEILIECPSNIESEISENVSDEIDPFECVKNHKCETCGKVFSLKGNLKKHLKHVHKGIKAYKCYICSRTFSQKGNLKIHISSVHEGAKNYKCDHCNQRFSQAGNLKQHLNR